MSSSGTSGTDVDPYDAAQVADVLATTLRLTGVGGLGDLLGRLPGVRLSPGVAKGFLRAAVAPSAWVGSEHQIVLSDPVVHQHVVGGVTLSRDTLRPGTLPAAVARLVGPVVREADGRDDAATALTAARDAFDTL